MNDLNKHMRNEEIRKYLCGRTSLKDTMGGASDFLPSSILMGQAQHVRKELENDRNEEPIESVVYGRKNIHLKKPNAELLIPSSRRLFCSNCDDCGGAVSCCVCSNDH